ncbi:MAG TPA: hypothetical protein VII94_03375 [Candidatus Saccharimonadales bacterium]
MAFVPVSQKNYDGCFIACAAMLMGTDYDTAFKRLHPGRNQNLLSSHGWEDTSGQVHVIALNLLAKLGADAKLAKWKRLKSFKRYGSKSAIVIIRWRHAPELCHCIFYSHKTKKFYDPSTASVIGPMKLMRLEKQMDCGIIVDKLSIKNKRVNHELHRSLSLNFGT